MTKPITILLALSLLSGCSVVRIPQAYNYDKIQSIKTAYVVKNDKSTRNIGLYIQKAISRRGIRTSYGPLGEKPDSVDVYVTYVDMWKWDLTIYFQALDVMIYDNKTNELLAVGAFHNRWLHSWPNPNKKVQQVVDSIFANNQLLINR
ncbi:MAG: hypothetical protein ABIK53_07560 [bacterium]